jgi:hypothetical protein
MIDVVCPVAFGPAITDGTYSRWLRQFKESNPRKHVVLITDAPADCEYMLCGVVGMKPLSKAGWMKAYATAQFPGKTVLTCDCDLMFTAGVDEIEVTGHVMLGEDAGGRRWSWHENGERFPELNSGVIVSRTGAFFGIYENAWDIRKNIITYDSDGGRTPEPPWIDEVVATATWRSLGGTILPRNWNFSHWWLNETNTPYNTRGAIHFHGNDGKAKLRELLK